MRPLFFPRSNSSAPGPTGGLTKTRLKRVLVRPVFFPAPTHAHQAPHGDSLKHVVLVVVVVVVVIVVVAVVVVVLAVVVVAVGQDCDQDYQAGRAVIRTARDKRHQRQQHI